jgi:hypothetical protein
MGLSATSYFWNTADELQLNLGRGRVLGTRLKDRRCELGRSDVADRRSLVRLVAEPILVESIGLCRAGLLFFVWRYCYEQPHPQAGHARGNARCTKVCYESLTGSKNRENRAGSSTLPEWHSPHLFLCSIAYSSTPASRPISTRHACMWSSPNVTFDAHISRGCIRC